ncbi:LuxR C-terminal-related transcriptional regulator [Streptomyces sp. NPDC058001]|uniref:helix-turn-helix transcriptional regulator n=1 Tax=Streptomyces sp. NPDC058001 TaxID=3346300 RepID=UPI0036EB831C
MQSTVDGASGHPHGVDDLCEAAERVYIAALTCGRIPRADAQEAPCLVELALLHPDPADLAWLLPQSPQRVMARMLGRIRDDLAAAHRGTAQAAAAAERYAAYATGGPAPAGDLRVLEGKDRIRAAIDEASDACTREMLTVHPDGIRREFSLAYSLPRTLAVTGRGVRMRTLYTHAARHGHGLHEYLERMNGDVEVRTLDEVTERLLIFDTDVAVIPANADRTIALEVRHPAVVTFLATAFERLWRLALPFDVVLPEMAGPDGITHRERAIAALLAEGHPDAEVARRLGINVRTCRHHIRKLHEVLGASSRTQLGVRLVQTGLDTPPRPPQPPQSPTVP